MGGGEGGGGGGGTCQYKIKETSKEKHSLTRKLVGYKNWRQRWCKKEGRRFLEKKNETKILYSCTCNNQNM